MKYVARRFYRGRRACVTQTFEAASREEALEAARKFWNNTTDKITVAEYKEDK